MFCSMLRWEEVKEVPSGWGCLINSAASTSTSLQQLHRSSRPMSFRLERPGDCPNGLSRIEYQGRRAKPSSRNASISVLVFCRFSGLQYFPLHNGQYHNIYCNGISLHRSCLNPEIFVVRMPRKCIRWHAIPLSLFPSSSPTLPSPPISS